MELQLNSSLSSVYQTFRSKPNLSSQLLFGGTRNNSRVRCARRGSASILPPPSRDEIMRRQLIAVGATVPGLILLSHPSTAFAVEAIKGFLPMTDKSDGYSFIYPFGWQEVVIEGQDKVFKDVIEPLESVSVTVLPTSKEDVKDLGSPQVVAETLIKKVLAPPTQKTKLIEAKQQDFDGKSYYTFEYIAQAPNFTRHALSAICIGNGKFYTLTTGANQRRWDKMKDRLYTVVDSFRVFNV